MSLQIQVFKKVQVYGEEFKKNTIFFPSSPLKYSLKMLKNNIEKYLKNIIQIQNKILENDSLKFLSKSL